eukprot:CAMPEP_0171336938 /NCGR_PEP_ID=MMETSP0878-20121228/6370_1 /TAXON_ID=67004 /ORGANISM="Thalassiosira weissflogii, Strain CCMP1336" /LENGTH=1011 /DNA_ID=CAMNT_0011838503 /DNA_START=25 /DNA_END=3060 /DNA_ORIENTATION=+
MNRAFSNASSGDEFFDAVEDATDLDRSFEGQKFVSRVDSKLKIGSKDSSEPSDEERNSDFWVSARSLFTDDSQESVEKGMGRVRSQNSLLDAVSESVSAEDTEMTEAPDATKDDDIEVSLQRIQARILAGKNSDSNILPDRTGSAASIKFQSVAGAAVRRYSTIDDETNDGGEADQRRMIGGLDLSLPLHKLLNNQRPMTPTENIIPDATGTAATTPSLSPSNLNSKQADDPEQYATPPHANSSNHSVSFDDCAVLDLMPCDIGSPLEALYLLCPKKDGEEGETDEDEGFEILQERFSTSADADPKGQAPLSPSSFERESGRRLEDDSSDDSSSEASIGVGKFRVVNKDTGSVHDMRDVLKEMNEMGTNSAFDTQYTILPSRNALEHQRSMSIDASKVDSEYADFEERQRLDTASYDDSTSSHSSSPTSSAKKLSSSMKKKATQMATSMRKGVNGLKSSHHGRARKRTVSGDMVPRNAIYVRSSTRQYQKAASSSTCGDASGTKPFLGNVSPFNPMLLVTTIPHAHEGPAWCASFSLDGRFLATGGEDGNVCIWAVAPKSKTMFPNGVEVRKQEEEGTEDHQQKDASLVESDEENDKVSETCPENPSGPTPLTTVGTGPEIASNMHIVSPEPLQRYKDHTADVIDLSWSHSNFLLSASLDSSVRLYHFSKPGCLHLFKHVNLVASVAFHPNDDRYFISGGVEKKLRLWSIPDGRVKEWAQTPDVITSARFTPDAKYVVAGLFRGQVYFYDLDGLKYYTQIACRNRSGKHRMGKKVTGISFLRGERDDWLHRSQACEEANNDDSAHDLSSIPRKLSDTGTRVANRLTYALRGHPRAEALRYTERMLVSTNDSRVRLYGLNDFCLVRKYKGHTNYSMQIRARVSESGDYIASGSESGHVFIWNTIDKTRQQKNVNIKINQTRDKAKSSDYFEASKAPLPIVTDAVFFPSKSMKEALVSSDIFPFSLGIDRVDDDFSSASILTLDYDGTIRVFLRKSCLDQILDAATPRGGEVL